jgi:hypothetical protein
LIALVDGQVDRAGPLDEHVDIYGPSDGRKWFVLLVGDPCAGTLYAPSLIALVDEQVDRAGPLDEHVDTYGPSDGRK